MASITNPLPWMKLFLLGNDIVGINDSFIFALCSLPLWLHTACTLMEWNPFRLTKSFRSCWVPESSHGSRRRSQLHQGTFPCRKTLAWLLAIRWETATKWIFSASGLEQATHPFTTLETEDLGGRRCHRWVVESCRSQRNPMLQEFVVSATAYGFSSSVAADGFQGFLWEIQ